jgi:chromosome segregation ATPase
MTAKTSEQNTKPNLNALRTGAQPEPTIASLTAELEQAKDVLREASERYDQLNKAIKVAADALTVARRDYQHHSSRLQSHLRNAPGNQPAGRGQAR